MQPSNPDPMSMNSPILQMQVNQCTGGFLTALYSSGQSNIIYIWAILCNIFLVMENFERCVKYFSAYSENLQIVAFLHRKRFFGNIPTEKCST